MEQSRKPKRWRRLWVGLAIFLLMLPTLVTVYLAQYTFIIAPETTLAVTPQQTVVETVWPDEGRAAVGAVGYGMLANSGRADQTVPIASITKLFTALAILEKKPLAPGQSGELITMTPTDEALYHSYLARQGSVLPVRAGQQLSQYELMQALLIPSANNAADTLAVWAFGSMDNYLAYANDMVQRMGLRQTTLTDASGFSPGSASSTQDLIRTMEAALQNQTIASIISQPSAVVNGALISSTNKILGQDNIIGGKTGNTDEAGDCFVFAANYTPSAENSVTIIGVLLGQSNRSRTFTRAETLLLSAQKSFGVIQIAPAGSVIGHYQTPWNTRSDIVADRDLEIFGWLGSSPKPEFSLRETAAGASAGQEVGSVSIKTAGKTHQTTASLKTAITKPSMFWRFTHIRRFF